MKVKQQIERKFLVKELPDLSDWRKEEIQQWYLTPPNDFKSIRIRLYNDIKKRCYIDIIHGKGLIRDKYYKKINWDNVKSEINKFPYVKKNRYKKKINDVLIVVDIFDDGLKIVEIESYDNKDNIINYNIPNWFGDEVTDNIKYSNNWIAYN